MTGSEALPVIIIGGGLAGLSLAQSLKHQGIPYQVYEREASPRDHQGWSMSIHFCLPVLASNIDPEFYSTFGNAVSVNPRFPHQVEFSLVDGKTNDLLFKVDPSSVIGANGQKPEMYRVNRKRFRNWLMQGIDINWGKQVNHFDIVNNNSDDDGVEVTFNDGTKVKGSCLIGADGVHSSICMKLLGEERFNKVTTINPVYNLIITRWLSNEDYARVQRISKAFLMAFGKLAKKYDYDGDDEYLACFISLNDQDFTSDRPHEVVISLSRYDPDRKLPRFDDNVNRLKLLKEWATQGLGGDLLDLILETPDGTDVTTVIIRERYPQEDALKNHQGRVTLVGDAVHSQTMFRGEGANHAILDAALLSKNLVRAYNNEISFYEAIEQYQEEMIPRGSKAVTESHDAAEYTHKSPFTMIKTIQAIVDKFKQQ